jgi:hypothetical protein
MKSDRISKQLKMKNIRWEYFYKTLILDLHVCHHLLERTVYGQKHNHSSLSRTLSGFHGNNVN